MASDVPLRSARLPSPPEVTGLLEGEFARGGYVIEDVTVQATSRPPRVVVIADPDDDHDGDLDLDALAELSRVASEVLDRQDDAVGGYAPYVLEVTSRGVDRPLTVPRHFRRAQGRRADVVLADGARLQGRLGALSDGAVDLVVSEGGRGKYTVRQLALAEITSAVVQVEFSPANRRELELAGVKEEESSG